MKLQSVLQPAAIVPSFFDLLRQIRHHVVFRQHACLEPTNARQQQLSSPSFPFFHHHQANHNASNSTRLFGVRKHFSHYFALLPPPSSLTQNIVIVITPSINMSDNWGTNGAHNANDHTDAPPAEAVAVVVDGLSKEELATKATDAGWVKWVPPRHGNRDIANTLTVRPPVTTTAVMTKRVNTMAPLLSTNGQRNSATWRLRTLIWRASSLGAITR